VLFSFSVCLRASVPLWFFFAPFRAYSRFSIYVSRRNLRIGFFLRVTVSGHFISRSLLH
jgi:hypothetical protein